MQPKKYMEESERTVSNDYDAIGNRINPSSTVEKQQKIDLLHAAMGMSTESNEFLDSLKKTFFYGKPLDKVNLIEELGDQMWYIAMALRALDADFESVMQLNIDKLKLRYPKKFTEKDATERDLKLERLLLER